MKKTLAAVIFFTVISNLSAAPAKEIFNKAVAEYIRGNRPESIEFMETALKTDVENREMKEFFVKILTEYGSESFLTNDYVAAEDYLKRAEKIDPGNKEIKKMLKLCARMTGADAESSGARSEDLSELVKEFKKQKDKVSANFNYSIEMINSLMKQNEKERTELIKGIAVQRTADRGKMNKIIIIAAAVLVVILFMAFFITQSVMRKFVAGREIMTLDHQKKIMDEIRSGVSVHTALPPLVRNSTHEIITDIDPVIREKARRIELIEEELKTEKDPNIATTFFLPYLDDSNNRVRANAAKALYRHNSKLSLVTFKDMISSANEWMRASAVWALGELACDETVDLIALLKNEKNLRVLAQIQATLNRVAKRPDVSGKVKADAAEMLNNMGSGLDM